MGEDLFVYKVFAVIIFLAIASFPLWFLLEIGIKKMWDIVTSWKGYVMGCPGYWTTGKKDRKRIEVSNKKGRVKIKITDEGIVTEFDSEPKEALEFAMAIATNAKLANKEKK
nr:MAG TPA: hypothetical protein [Caudoviricetes sp.]